MPHEHTHDDPIHDALEHLSEAERDRAEARELRARAEALDARADVEEREVERELEHAEGGHGHEGHGGGDGDEHSLINIIVNGREKQVHRGQISYEQVLELAFGSSATAVTHTVNWRLPDGDEGSLVPGESVKAREGMIFTATATNRS